MKGPLSNTGVNRRLLLKGAAAVGAGSLASPGWSLTAPPRPKAVFIFVPMGSIRNEWFTPKCVSSPKGGRIYAPFESVEQHCIVPRGINIPRAGFGRLSTTLCSSPFAKDAMSVDALYAQYLSSGSPGGHLKLFAGSLDDALDDQTVTVESGNRLTLKEYENDPSNLAMKLSKYSKSKAIEADQNKFRRTGDSEFSWRARQFLDLTKDALTQDYTNVVTIMLGDDNARILPPEGLDFGSRQPRSNLTLREMPATGYHDAFIEFKRYIHSLVAEFIQGLDSTTPDLGNGGSMLKRTQVYLFSNVGDGNSYSGHNAPILLAGGSDFYRTPSQPFIGSTHELLNAMASRFGHATAHGPDLAVNILGKSR